MLEGCKVCQFYLKLFKCNDSENLRYLQYEYQTHILRGHIKMVKRPSSGGMMPSKEAGRADDWGSIPQGPTYSMEAWF